MRRRHALLALLLVLAAGTARVRADRVGAEAQLAIAEKARAKGQDQEADASLRKAVEEDPTYLPARLAWGEALLARGDFPGGIAEITAAGALAAEPAALEAWPAVAARARKRAQELEAVAAALRGKVEKHVADAMALATRWKEKDPDLARAWLERVLRMAPDHVEATALLAGLVPQRKGTSTPLFQVPSMIRGLGNREGWTIEPGIAKVSTGDENGGLWMEEPVSGDFDLRAEVRIVAEQGTPVVAALVLIHAVGDVSSFGFIEGQVRWEERRPGKDATLFQKPPLEVSYEPGRWTRMEMRMRGDKGQGWLDSKLLCEVLRREPKAGAQVGLRFLHARVEFRNVELFRPSDD
jgi:tetratricopeptide (TPR) repeat protein